MSSSCGGLPPPCQEPLPRGEPGRRRKHCGLIGHVPTAEMQPHSCRTRGSHLDEPTRPALAGFNTGFPHIQEDTSDCEAPLVLCKVSLFPTNHPPPQVFLYIQTFTVKGDSPRCSESGQRMVFLNCVLKRKNSRGTYRQLAADGPRAHLHRCLRRSACLFSSFIFLFVHFPFIF